MDSEILKRRIIDTASISLRTEKSKFLGFLSVEEAMFAKQILKNFSVNFSFFGGCDTSQRVMLGCFPDWVRDIDFPITPITFTFRKSDILKHKDFLGSLMGLGVKREAVGDILVEEGRAVVFVCNDIADFVVSQLDKVGRTGVVLNIGYSMPLPKCDELLDGSDTVASARLDCVVSALANFSRQDALQAVLDGRVSINSQICEKVSKTVNNGDIVTIRGKGKFIIDSLTDKSRKNRYIIKYKKYV